MKMDITKVKSKMNERTNTVNLFNQWLYRDIKIMRINTNFKRKHNIRDGILLTFNIKKLCEYSVKSTDS